MGQRFSILSAVGITIAIMFGLLAYASFDLIFEPDTVAAHARAPKGGHLDEAAPAAVSVLLP